MKCDQCKTGDQIKQPLDENRVRVTCSNPTCGLNEVRDRQGRKLLTEVMPSTGPRRVLLG